MAEAQKGKAKKQAKTGKQSSSKSSRRGKSKRGKSDEFDTKMIDLRRVTRVEAGGRRFSFRATVIAGDRNGRVGVGVGKGKDAALAIEKASREAKKKAITVPVTEEKSIPHDVETKFASARVLIRRSREGSGLVAGSAVRTVLDLAGVKNATAKVLSRTRNKINNARAALQALQQFET